MFQVCVHKPVLSHILSNAQTDIAHKSQAFPLLQMTNYSMMHTMDVYTYTCTSNKQFPEYGVQHTCMYMSKAAFKY